MTSEKEGKKTFVGREEEKNEGEENSVIGERKGEKKMLKSA